jgi:hypothetical protein
VWLFSRLFTGTTSLTRFSAMARDERFLPHSTTTFALSSRMDRLLTLYQRGRAI